jgi:hypothetical protein
MAKRRPSSAWHAQDAARGTRRVSNPHSAFAEAERSAAAFDELAAQHPHAFKVPAARGRWVVLVHRDTGSKGWQATTFEGDEPIMDRRSATWRGLLDSIRRDPIDWTKVRRINA